MTGYHTRWVRPTAEADDPERIAIREALAFGKAVYDRRTALSMTVAELATHAGMTIDEVDCIEEGGTEQTVALLRRLAAASTQMFASSRVTTWVQWASRPTLPDLRDSVRVAAVRPW